MSEDRQMAIELIDEACAAGARLARACAVLEVDVRTLRRWQRQQQDEQHLVDRRREAAADRVPANKLSPEERERILAVCNDPAYQSLPPSQIVPRLADKGEYLASESTFYRVLREADQQHRRGRAQGNRSIHTDTSPVEKNLIAETRPAVLGVAGSHESAGAPKQNPGEVPGFGNR